LDGPLETEELLLDVDGIEGVRPRRILADDVVELAPQTRMPAVQPPSLRPIAIGQFAACDAADPRGRRVGLGLVAAETLEHAL
jgi:hypothetical protein